MGSDGVDVRMFAQPFDVAAAVAAVTAAEAGGIDIFLGTTRAEVHAELGALVALDYHAYEEMAIGEMRALVEKARGRWPVTRAVLWHRTGEVRLGEASVLIAVSCPHRGEAFAACQFLIDELKKRVPIWKKERYERDSRWQGTA